MIVDKNLCIESNYVNKRLLEITNEISNKSYNYSGGDRHHSVPAFIMRKFCDPKLEKKKQVFSKATFEYNLQKHKMESFIIETQKADTYTRGFQTFITSQKDAYNLEKFFACIERSSAPLIKSVENQIYSFNTLSYNVHREYNIFKDEKRNEIFIPRDDLDTRLLLSLFLASLMLRTSYYQAFMNNRLYGDQKLGDVILDDFLDFSQEIYSRKWVFGQFDRPVLFSSNIVTPWTWGDSDGRFITPISKKIVIYMLNKDSHYHDYDLYENFSKYKDVYYSMAYNITDKASSLLDNIGKNKIKLSICTSYNNQEIFGQIYKKEYSSKIIHNNLFGLLENKKMLINYSRFGYIFGVVGTRNLK